MGEIIHILYHADWDGLVAAWVARNGLKGPGVTFEFQPVQYGYPPPEVPLDRDVYILDFSFEPDVFDAFCKDRRGKIVMLDHHKTAIEQFQRWRIFDNPEGTFQRYIEAAEPGERQTTVILEDGTAGCTMTWVYMRGGYDGDPITEPPLLAQYAADHDLWKFELPNSKEIRAVMRSYPQVLESCDELNEKLCYVGGFDGLVAEGRAITRFMQRQIETACRHAELFEIDGHRCWGAQVPFDGLISEVAGELAKKPGGEFGLCWFKARGTEWIYSLRSRGDFDVSEVAKKFGGGGHAKAAGFSSVDSPICFLSVEKSR